MSEIMSRRSPLYIGGDSNRKPRAHFQRAGALVLRTLVCSTSGGRRPSPGLFLALNICNWSPLVGCSQIFTAAATAAARKTLRNLRPSCVVRAVSLDFFPSGLKPRTRVFGFSSLRSRAPFLDDLRETIGIVFMSALCWSCAGAHFLFVNRQCEKLALSVYAVVAAR